MMKLSVFLFVLVFSVAKTSRELGKTPLTPVEDRNNPSTVRGVREYSQEALTFPKNSNSKFNTFLNERIDNITRKTRAHVISISPENINTFSSATTYSHIRSDGNVPMEPKEVISTSERHQNDYAQDGHSEGHGPKPPPSILKRRYGIGHDVNYSGQNGEGRVLTGDLCNNDDHTCSCSKDFTLVNCKHTHALHEEAIEELHLNRDLIPRAVRDFTIIGFELVTIAPDTFADENLQLREITFSKIQNLTIKRHSFRFSDKASGTVVVNLNFEETNIPEIPPFGLTQLIKGDHHQHGIASREMTRFLSISFKSCTIGTIRRNGLSSARIDELTFTNTKITELETKAIDLHVNTISLFELSHFPILKANSICLHSGKVIFKNNTMKELQKHSIAIEAEGQVEFDSNDVFILRGEALIGIQPILPYGGSVLFLQNRIRYAEPKALVLHDSVPLLKRKVIRNKFDVPCECNITNVFQQLLGIKPQTEGEEDFSQDDYLALQVVVKTSDCAGGFNPFFSLNVGSYLKRECAPFPIAIVIALSTSGFLFIVLVITCVVCIVRWQSNRDMENSLRAYRSPSFSTISRQITDSPTHCCGHEYPITPRSPIEVVSIPWFTGPEYKTYQQEVAYDLTEKAESIRGSIDQIAVTEGRFIARASCPFN